MPHAHSPKRRKSQHIKSSSFLIFRVVDGSRGLSSSHEYLGQDFEAASPSFLALLMFSIRVCVVFSFIMLSFLGLRYSLRYDP